MQEFTQVDTDCLCIPNTQVLNQIKYLKTTLVNKKNIWRIIDMDDAVHFYDYRTIFIMPL